MLPLCANCKITVGKPKIQMNKDQQQGTQVFCLWNLKNSSLARVIDVRSLFWHHAKRYFENF